MRNFLKIRSAIAAAVAVIGCAVVALTPAFGSTAVATCAKLVLTGHPSYPPVSWATGAALEGAGIDVVRKIAQKAGVAVQIVNEGSWNAAQQAVIGGKADAIVGLYRTQARLASFAYVEPAIAPDPSSVVIRAGEPFTYKDWNSLIGKSGVTNKGESFGHDFDTFAASKLSLRHVAGFPVVYQALLDNQADYALAGYYPAQTEMPKGLAIAVPNFATEGLYLAFGKHTPCASLAPAFSKSIAAMIADGTIKKMFAASLAAYQATHPKAS
jgi:polar amino acid transport system substrate-binding protein